MRRLTVDLPEAPWVEIPLGGGDPADWAEREARGICREEHTAAALAVELAAVAMGTRDRPALACAVLVPHEEPERVVGMLLVEQVRCGPDVAAVTAELAADGSTHVRPPDTTDVRLPLGAAVRRHSVVALPDGTVVEGVEHVLPLGDGTGVRADLSWQAVAAGDLLVRLADGAAEGLRLVPAS